MPDKSRKEKGTANAGSTTRDITAAQRVTLAIKLRASKISYEQIARQCGYADRGSAHKAVQREMERIIADNVEELRREECATLDTLQAECFKRMIDKEYSKPMLFAVDRILAICERRAKLLGLDVRPDMDAAMVEIVIQEVPHGYLASEVTE